MVSSLYFALKQKKAFKRRSTKYKRNKYKTIANEKTTQELENNKQKQHCTSYLAKAKAKAAEAAENKFFSTLCFTVCVYSETKYLCECAYQ